MLAAIRTGIDHVVDTVLSDDHEPASSGARQHMNQAGRFRLGDVREIQAGLGPGGARVTGGAGAALRSTAIGNGIAGLGEMVEAHREALAGALEQSVAVAEWKRGQRERRASG